MLLFGRIPEYLCLSSKSEIAIPSISSELIEAINYEYSKLKGDLLSIPHELRHVQELEGMQKNTLMSKQPRCLADRLRRVGFKVVQQKGVLG